MILEIDRGAGFKILTWPEGRKSIEKNYEKCHNSKKILNVPKSQSFIQRKFRLNHHILQCQVNLKYP